MRMNRFHESLQGDRLQEVVQRAGLHGLDAELVVGRGEDHVEGRLAAELFEHVETVEHGHLNVEKEQVRRTLAQIVQPLLRVVEGRYDLYLRAVVLQLPLQGFDAVHLVVDDYGLDLHNGLGLNGDHQFDAGAQGLAFRGVQVDDAYRRI